MSKVLMLCLCSHIMRSVADPNICIKNVEKSYTIKERVLLEDYGEFTNIYMNFTVPGELLSVTKPKLEAREKCCDGYKRSPKADEGCQPVPIVFPEEPSSTVFVSGHDSGISIDISEMSMLNRRYCIWELILLWAVAQYLDKF